MILNKLRQFEPLSTYLENIEPFMTIKNIQIIKMPFSSQNYQNASGPLNSGNNSEFSI